MKIKRVIEIDESLYNRIQERMNTLSDIPCLFGLVADSKPYNPSGDAISREALKEEFKRIYRCAETAEQLANNMEDAIDNAPPVPQVTVFTESTDEKAVADMKAELQNIIEARPQGEYISVDKLFAKCSICGNLTRVLKKYNMPNFCPACGADMRKGGEEK